MSTGRYPRELAPVSGSVGRRLDFPDFSLTETSYAAEVKLGRHYHAHPVLSFAVRGGTAVSFGRSASWCEQGSLLYLAPGDRHDNVYPEAAVRLHLEVKWRLWRQVGDGIGMRSGPIRHVLAAAAGRSLQSALSDADGLAEFTIATALMDIAGLLTAGRSAARDTAPWLVRLREFLEAHPLEKIEMAKLARVADRHPAHVSREFRRHFGKSLSQFVRERRLLRAAELMCCDGLPLAEVALQCGFYDQSHFTHAFRKLMGDSPAEYRSRRTVAQETMRPAAQCIK